MDELMMIVDPRQLDVALELLRFRMAFPRTGMSKKQEMAHDRETVRRVARVLTAKADSPLMTRVMGL